MEELKRFTDYEEYKAAVETELRKSAEGFVRIGYLLKQARDTNVLEGHYSNLQEFAQSEFGLDKSQVSRFIHINDRFSENGNSDKLMDHYMGFGYAKLTLMLQLPDSINEEITPSFTKTEIQTIKEELDEEKAVSDLEVMMEPVPDVIKKENEQLMKVVIALGESEPELYAGIYYQAHLDGWDIESLKSDMVQNEEKIYSVRVPGVGRFALSLKENGPVNLINMRSGDRSEHTWEELLQCWESQDLGMDPEEQWTCMYGKDFPKKVEPVAPVQPKKETKVTKAAPKEEKKVHIPKSTKENEEIDEPKEDPKEELKEEPRQQDSEIYEDENIICAASEPEYIEAEYKEVEEIQENVELTRADEEREEEKNDLLEYSRMTVDLLIRCLSDWAGDDMPIALVRACLQNMSELKETLEKLNKLLEEERK